MRTLFLTLAIVLTPPVALAQTQNVTLWGVTKHVDADFDQADADVIFREATEAIRIDNERCSDRPCQLTIGQLGTLGEFGSPGDSLDSISNDNELETAFDAPGRVTVVTAVNYCAGAYNESVIGCGECYFNNFVVESWVPAETWVHEFGHNSQDLLDCGHRNSCEDNLMHEYKGPNADAINTSECAMLSGINAHEWCGEMIMLSEPEWFNWVTCPVWVPTGGPWNGLFVTKPFDEWQFRGGTTLTSLGEFSTPGGLVDMYSNSVEKALPGLKLGENGRLKIINGGQIRFD